MPLTLSPDQRNALYDQILDRLSGIGDIELAVKQGDIPSAERLSREYSDDLRLVLDGLGFGAGTGEAVELAVPSDVLRRVLPRLRELAIRYTQQHGGEWRESEVIRERNELVISACDSALAALNVEPRGDRR